MTEAALAAPAAPETAACQLLLSWPLHAWMQEHLGLQGTLLAHWLQHLHLLRRVVHLQRSNDITPSGGSLQHLSEIFAQVG